MSNRRRVAVVTGSRAEYGLLQWLIEEISTDERLECLLIVTGMHLSTEFGLTVREVEAGNWPIDARVHMLLASDDPVAIAKSVSLGVSGMADALDRLRPDIVVLLGDRFEILAAAQAAYLLRIPIAHIHGGESSEGALDEGIRHAITKLAQLHFAAAEPYRRRLIRMGEHPSRVFMFGAPGLDSLSRSRPMSREELERDLNFKLRDPLFVATYHPATNTEQDGVIACGALLRAFDRMAHATVVITKPNADAGGRAVGAAIDQWGADRPRTCVRDSLGAARYWSLLRIASAVVGNSSSGLLEAPALHVPTVNIGERQDGRLKAASVIDCSDDEDAIVRALERALTREHRSLVDSMTLPYPVTGDASKRIKDTIASLPLDGILTKKFYEGDV